ncbi:hypothetical protein ACFSJD_28335 [Pseudonocardia yunnanensis]|uniref:Cytoplasmic protein n=1 Tax=Pseudonocardia yunnanensis TaxID=58107 RepID=A0ABW4F4X0_9PSEU
MRPPRPNRAVPDRGDDLLTGRGDPTIEPSDLTDQLDREPPPGDPEDITLPDPA